jgi:hypothetical protein
MRRSLFRPHKSKLLAALMATALALPAATASAWWGGYGAPGWGCDPHWAYLEEYGFLDPYGPSPTDWRRLNRDQWRAATSGAYYHNFRRYDPVAQAVRRQCHLSQRPYW